MGETTDNDEQQAPRRRLLDHESNTVAEAAHMAREQTPGLGRYLGSVEVDYYPPSFDEL